MVSEISSDKLLNLVNLVTNKIHYENIVFDVHKVTILFVIEYYNDFVIVDAASHLDAGRC